MPYLNPRLALTDTTTQVIVTPGVQQAISFNTVDSVRKFIVVSPTEFEVIESGFYLIAYTPQIQLASGANQVLNIYPAVDGVPVPNSNNRWKISNNNDFTVACLNNVFIDSGSAIQLYMNGDNSNLRITNVAAGGGIPLTPSIICVIQKQS